MLGVFVVLGIGADDTFIFIDTFKDSRKRLSSVCIFNFKSTRIILIQFHRFKIGLNGLILKLEKRCL